MLYFNIKLFVNFLLILSFFIFCWEFNFVFADSPEAWQLSFQDPATPIMQGIIELHHDIFFILIIVVTFVFWLLFKIVYNFNYTKNKTLHKINYSTAIEIIWTIIPALILVVVAIPSFALLYSMDEVINPAITIKVIGHQWYWSYEYSDYAIEQKDSSFVFDSYLVNEEDLNLGQFRLLEVDKRLVLPIYTHIRVIITSADVLHSWAVPSLGLKIDSCPGRLNQTSMFIDRPGIYYGQCSEICGINHGFMPIAIEAVDIKTYISWISMKYMEDSLE